MSKFKYYFLEPGMKVEENDERWSHYNHCWESVQKTPFIIGHVVEDNNNEWIFRRRI
jgi:hypothetical protein